MNNTTTTNNTIDKLNSEIIHLTEQIAAAQTAVMKKLLAQLRDSKIREIELLQKLAKKSSTKKDFTVAESIAKSLFVALRPHVDDDGLAKKAFKAAVAAITDTLSVELQTNIFTNSILHCSKSNFNKAVDITAAYNSYCESVKQAKLLLPDITTWDSWLKAVQEAALRAANKRGIAWEVPAYPKTVEAEGTAAEQAAAEQAAAEQAAAEQAAAEQAAAEQAAAEGTDKKIIITTRKNGKK